MSNRRRFGYQPDANRDFIIAQLETAGALVEALDRRGDGIPDLLVGFRGQLFLLEVKNPETCDPRRPRRALRPDQTAFFRKWRGFPVFLVFTPRQALRAIGAA